MPRHHAANRSSAPDALYERFGRPVYARLRRVAPATVAADLTVAVFATACSTGQLVHDDPAALEALLREANRQLVAYHRRPSPAPTVDAGADEQPADPPASGDGSRSDE